MRANVMMKVLIASDSKLVALGVRYEQRAKRILACVVGKRLTYQRIT